MGRELSDEQIVELFRTRKRRQWLVFGIGFPAAMGWMALVAVVFHRVVESRPAMNGPILFTGLLVPFFVGFAVGAARFSERNLRCPACDARINLYGTRYYSRSFNCPACGRALSR